MSFEAHRIVGGFYLHSIRIRIKTFDVGIHTSPKVYSIFIPLE